MRGSAAEADHGGDPQRVRVRTVERLVEHLDRRHGHAVLMGPSGFGVGSALHACAAELELRGRRMEIVPLHVMTSDEDMVWPELQVDDVLALDARHARDTRVVADALRVASSSGAQLLLVTSQSEADEEMVAGVRDQASIFVLRPWNHEEIEQFLESRSLVERDVDQVARLTGGLPWLLRYLRPSAEDDPLASGAGAPTSERVGAFVIGLLDSCDPQVAEAVVALAVGYPLNGHPALPGAAVDDRGAHDRLVRAVESAGLLGADGHLPPLVRDSVIRFAPAHWVDRARAMLVDDVVGAGADLTAWAPDLIRQGSTDPRVVNALVEHVRARRAGASLDESEAGEIDELLGRALRSGAHRRDLRLERCRLSLCRGDLDAATRELDRLLAEDGGTAPPDTLVVGLEVAHAMNLPHLAENVVRWVEARDPGVTGHPAVALTRYAVGDLEGADEAARLAEARAEPSLSAATLLARGVRVSVTEGAPAALPLLMQAAKALGRPGEFTDDPRAFVALWGLHAGDLRLVESTVGAALDGEPPLVRSRLVVLGAWAAMYAGRHEEALSLVDGLGSLAPRDRLWVSALRAGVARRQDDSRRLRVEWDRARDALLSHPVSLWQLLPLGELGLAAARMRDFEVVRPLWDRAAELLVELGEPALWSTPFHWYAVQVALQQDAPRAVAPHAAALVRAARGWRQAAVLSSAGRAWVRVRARDVDPGEVEQAARALAAAGLPWEAARLASHGAGAAASRRDRDRLNECAREILPRGTQSAKGRADREGSDPVGSRQSAEHRSSGSLQLTEREWQVAELVLSGRTYRQIGETLYLSPKTVEHHVARIKRRSGAGSRAELLELLMTVMGDDPAG